MIQITSATPDPIPPGGTITITVTGGPIDSAEIKPLPNGRVTTVPGSNANTIILGPFRPGSYQITVKGVDGTSDSVIVTAN